MTLAIQRQSAIAYLRRRGVPPHDAEDLAHDAVVEVLARQLPVELVRRVVRFRLLDATRRYWRRVQATEPVHLFGSRFPQPDDGMQVAERCLEASGVWSARSRFARSRARRALRERWGVRR